MTPNPNRAVEGHSVWALRIVCYLYRLSAFLLLLLAILALILNLGQGNIWGGIAYGLILSLSSISLLAIAQAIDLILDTHKQITELMRRLKAK